MKRRDGVTDWSDLRERLRESARRLEDLWSPGPDYVDAIFRKRAERLALRADGDAKAREAPVEILVFRAGEERYGIELRELSRVLARPRCAPVPGAPAALVGVVQVRGEIRPVWDLARLLGIGGREAANPEAVLIVRRPGGEAGLAADGVEGIRTEDRDELQPVPEGPPGRRWTTKDLVVVLAVDELMNEVGA